MHTFIPSWSPHALAVTLMAFTAIYTVASGLYGVVLTGMIQFLLILLGSGFLIAKAISLSSYDTIAARMPADWFGFWPASFSRCSY